VAIAERHVRKIDEDERLLRKHAAGCRFFISQTVFDASATKSMLSDYALRLARENLAPVPFILSFSPCGSLKTMEFMKWLGIAFPRWLENDLSTAPNILRKSLDLALQIFADVRAFAKDKGIPLGVNVESVSIRAEEIEAAGELFEALSAGM
jgi:5,10-methylenetetrahydrofolate reductase